MTAPTSRDELIVLIDERIAAHPDVRRPVYRRGPTDEELRQAAEVYRSAERAPTETVSERFGIALRTASLWMKRARELGYLPPAVWGKASR